MNTSIIYGGHLPIQHGISERDWKVLEGLILSEPHVETVYRDGDSWWEWGEPLGTSDPDQEPMQVEHVSYRLGPFLAAEEAKQIATRIAAKLTAHASRVAVIPHVVTSRWDDWAEQL